MAQALSTYLQEKIANWIKGAAFGAAPGSLTLALSTADPLDNGSGLVEPGGGYARQTITFGVVTSNETDGSVIANNALVQFPDVGASIITHVAIFDGGSNMLFHAPLASTKAVQAGSTVDFIVGSLTIGLVGAFATYLASSVLAWVKGTAMPAAPTSLRAKLSIGNPLRSGASLNEPPGTDAYLFQTLAFGSIVSTNGVGSVMSNSGVVLFGPAATNAWSPITHAVVTDQANNQLIQGAVAVAQGVPIGEGYGINAGQLSLTIR